MFRCLPVALFALASIVNPLHAEAIHSSKNAGPSGIVNAGAGNFMPIGFPGDGPLSGINFSSGENSSSVHFRDLSPGNPNAGPQFSPPQLNQLRLGGGGNPFNFGGSGMGMGMGFRRFGGGGGFGRGGGGGGGGGSGFNGANGNSDNGNPNNNVNNPSQNGTQQNKNTNNPSQNGNQQNNNINNPAASANGNRANGNAINNLTNALLSNQTNALSNGSLANGNPNILAPGSVTSTSNPALTGLGSTNNTFFGLARNANLAPNTAGGVRLFAARANRRFGQSPTQIPEPGTLLVLGMGVAGLAVYNWRRREAKSRSVG
jgi:hypothetical protein